MNVLGAKRVQIPTTAGDFLARFLDSDIAKFQRTVASLCRDTIIVEFCLPTDDIYRRRHTPPNNWIKSSWASILDIIRIVLLKALCSLCPLIVVGGIEYHRMFYFSTKAFWTIFVVHNKIFTESLTYIL